jgi:ABC-type multidrug transport system fused ATPase/permease subunit
VASISMVFSYLQNALFMMAAEKQAKKIRTVLFSSILKQDIGWFDVYKGGELTTRLTELVIQFRLPD